MSHKITIIVSPDHKNIKQNLSEEDADELQYQIQDLLTYWELDIESLTIDPISEI